MADEIDQGGRPAIVLSEEQREVVAQYAGYLNTEQLADLLGIARSTLFEIFKRDEQVSGLYKKNRADVIAKIANSLAIQAIKGNTSAQMFYLKTQAGWRETDGGDDGTINPIQIIMPGAEIPALPEPDASNTD